MAENLDPLQDVSSTPTITHYQGNNVPVLPRLPSLDLESGISALSPEASMFTGQSQRAQTEQRNTERSNNTEGLRILNSVQQDQLDITEGEQEELQPVDVTPVDDESSRPSSVNSDVILIDEESSDIEVVSDSESAGDDTPVAGDDTSVAGDDMSVAGDDDNLLSRPDNPVPALDQTVTNERDEQVSARPQTMSFNQQSATPRNSAVATLQNVQVLGADGQSPADFRSPKRKRVHSPEKKTAGASNKDNVGEEEEGDTCPICFEPWTTSGLHRLCSLRCGHLFGQSCIEKWLKGHGGKCPHCNAKAKRQDVRVLYAKSIKALDTTELERALKDLEKERENKRRVEMEGAQLRLQYQLAMEENNNLKLEVESLKFQLKKSGGVALAGPSSRNKLDSSQGMNNSQIAGQFVLDKTIKIWDAGNCRVIAYSPSLATIVASQPSSSPLFPGFGIKKICTLDFKTSQYITIHSKPIRAVAFHPSVEDGMLLSCGLDKKVKMTSMLSNAVVQSYDTPMPAWSCVWNAEDRNYFYAGLQNGLVLEFDIRNTDSPVQEFNREGSRSPVASLCFMCKDLRADFRSGGLLIGQLDRVSFFECLPSNQHKLHLLPLEGSLTSLYIETDTRHILASYRPAGQHPTIRHQLCEMISQNISTDPTVINNVCSCNVIHTFYGGRTQTILSKTILQRHPGDMSRLLVCAGDETSNSVHLWDSGTGQLVQRLLTGGVTVDMCSFNINNTTYLATLTDKQCKVFKWT